MPGNIELKPGDGVSCAATAGAILRFAAFFFHPPRETSREDQISSALELQRRCNAATLSFGSIAGKIAATPGSQIA